MKILYHALPYMMGGPETFLKNLFQYLDHKRFEPVVVSFHKSSFLSELNSKGIQTSVIDSTTDLGREKLIRFIRSGRIHLVQTSHYYPSAAVAAARAGVPHLWRVGSDIHNICKDIHLNKRNDFLNAMSRLSSKIVCMSQFVSQQFIKIAPSKIKIIYPGIDLEKMDQVPDHLGIPKKGFKVGMVAHLAPQKRHLDFIRAAKKVSEKLLDTKFIIFGQPYPNKESLLYEKLLHQTIRKMRMKQIIIFRRAHQNILKAIQDLDLFVLPSIDEGASNAVLEAMALKKPIVACHSGGMAELIEDKITGFLVPPMNPQKLFERIMDILKDPEKSKKMGEAGRQRTERLFEIKRVAREFESVYEEMIRNSN